jgi:hypothetical protein
VTAFFPAKPAEYMSIGDKLRCNHRYWLLLQKVRSRGEKHADNASM